MPCLSLFEYAELIYNDPDQPVLNMDDIKQDLTEYKKLLFGVITGTVKPSSVIGTGYKYPKKEAIRWLNNSIDEYQNIVDRLKIHNTIVANYGYLRAKYDMNKHKHITH